MKIMINVHKDVDITKNGKYMKNYHIWAHKKEKGQTKWKMIYSQETPTKEKALKLARMLKKRYKQKYMTEMYIR